MRRKHTFLVMLAVVAALGATRTFAHEDKTDPVCGMRVDPDVVPWKADYAGETYYFCMEADRDTFLGDPEKYAGALTLTSARERHELVLVIRPRAPKEGEVVKLAARGFAIGDRMASPPKPPQTLEDPVAIVYEMDRSAPPEPERYRLVRIKGDDDVYGLARTTRSALAWRVVVEATFDGARRRGVFTIPIAPIGSATAADHDHDHVPATTKPDAEHAGHDDGGLSMSAQHEAMKTIGRHWYALGGWLRGGPGTRDDALAHLGEVEKASRDVPRFMLHKFQEALPEFQGYAGELGRELTSFRKTLASGTREEAERAFREVEARSCTKCHVKFRFGAVEDLSRFPDVRELPKER